jgi:SM-20-related protein
LDQFRGDRARVISVITYLNPDWTDEDGGHLALYTDKGPVHILPRWGRTVMFRSEELEHEVLPGRKERRSITGWLR